jgi:alpha,alpha-trehalose-phosphate synthase [UDP-forming]
VSLTVVANRLPVEAAPGGGLQPSPGGLVAALSSVIGDGDRWVGWGGTDAAGRIEFGEVGLHLEPVPLTEGEVDRYYGGFANSVLWPLFHGRLRPVELDRAWWRTYRNVNKRFAMAAAKGAPHSGTVWVHDYHLMLVPAMLRRLRPDLRIGFFLHIPFPNAQLFASLPWRRDVITGLLGADVVGFQLTEDADNFLAAADRCANVTATDGVIRRLAHHVAVGAFPISIDFQKWEALGADSVDAAQQLRADLGVDTVLLGIERLDYTKGIAQRIRAFGELLDEGRLSADDVTFVQVAVPTRGDLPAYQDERDDVEEAVYEVNSRHVRRTGSVPVRYLEGGLDERELAAWYRAADVMMVTSLADGMNLVAKEFVATRGDGVASVVLSEFAGAAHELADGAVIVNPYDIDAIKQALLSAVHMPTVDKVARMDAMRAVVRRHDVHHWASTFLHRLHEMRAKPLLSAG